MRKGQKHSVESLRKIKENNARRGKKFIFTETHRENLSKANKGQIPWVKGKKQSKDHIAKRVQARIANGTNPKITAPRGASHYLYKINRDELKKDGKRNDSAHRDWTREVKRRDGWHCRIADQDCAGRMEAHHILSWHDFPELRYKLNNGITLCHFHHPRRRIDEKRMSSRFQSLNDKQSNSI